MTALLFSLLFQRMESLGTVFLCTGAAVCLLAVGTLLVVQEDFPLFYPLLAGLLAGWLWCGGYGLLFWQPAQTFDGRIADVRLVVTDYAQSYTSYGVAEGIVTEVDGDTCRQKVKVYLQDGSPNFAPGDVLFFPGQFTVAQRTFSGNLLQEGRFLTLSQEGALAYHPGEAVNLLRRMRILSHTITLRIQALLPGDEGALLAALLSGDRNGFSDGFDRALIVSGTRHITAVSGLHVSILAGILMQLMGKKAGLLMAVPAAVTYAAIVGFSPSVVRAVILLLFWTGSFWLRQEKDSLTAMAAALVLLVAWNPFSVRSVGLLLSFAATLGLIVLSAPLNGVFTPLLKRMKQPVLRKLLHYITGTVTATLAATAFTLPLNLLFFETVPLMSILSNLLILWAISLVMLMGIVVLLLSLFLPGVAAFFACWVLRWPLLWIVAVIRVIGTLPFAATDSANLVLAVCILVLLTALLLWRGKLLSGEKLLVITAALICVTTVFTMAERMLMGVVEVDNAGGQPVILVRSEGLSLVNCGARIDVAAQTVADACARWNISQLDTLLCTTGDYKSQSGLAAVLEGIRAQRVLLPYRNDGIPEAHFGVTALTFTASGTTLISGEETQLLKAGEDAFAFRLLTRHFSLISLCGLRVEDALTLLENNALQADLLLVDDIIANDWQALYTLCEEVQPAEILVTSNGHSEHGESFCGIPLTMIGREGVRFRFLR